MPLSVASIMTTPFRSCCVESLLLSRRFLLLYSRGGRVGVEEEGVVGVIR